MKSPFAHFIIALVVGTVVAAGYIGWYAAVSHKSKNVADLQNQIAFASENMGRVAAARAVLAEIANDENKIQNYFVSEASVVSFINELEALGAQEHSTVKVVSVLNGGTRVLPTVLVTLSIDGAFDAVMRTVGAVEYSPYAISVSTLSIIRVVADVDTEDHWHADLAITVNSTPVASATSTPRL